MYMYFYWVRARGYSSCMSQQGLSLVAVLSPHLIRGHKRSQSYYVYMYMYLVAPIFSQFGQLNGGLQTLWLVHLLIHMYTHAHTRMHMHTHTHTHTHTCMHTHMRTHTHCTVVRQNGKNYEALANSLEEKTVAQCRNFFTNYKRKLNLPRIIAEYETRHVSMGIMGVCGRASSLEFMRVYTVCIYMFCECVYGNGGMEYDRMRMGCGDLSV